MPLDESGTTYRSLILQAYPDLEIEHLHHAGNSSGVVDGSAAVLLGQHTDRSVFDVSDAEREAILEQAWESRSGFKFTGSFKDVRTNPAANEIVAEFVRRKIRQTVKDPEVAGGNSGPTSSASS